MRIVVTGGSGFIGGHVVENLERRGHEVVNIDCVPPKWYASDSWHRCEIVDSFDVAKALGTRPVDGIVHLAAMLGTEATLGHESSVVDVNVIGTLNMLEIARLDSARFIALNTANTWLNPYTITKATAGRFTLMYGQEFGVPVTLVREAHVYGPRQKADATRKVVPTFITRALRGEPLEMYSGGEHPVCLTHVQDVAEGLVRLVLDRDACIGREITFATGPEMSVRDLAARIIRETGSASDIVSLGRRPGQNGRDEAYGNTEAIMEACGSWKTVPLALGLSETVNWYRSAIAG